MPVNGKSKLNCVQEENRPLLNAINSYCFSKQFEHQRQKLLRLRRSIGLYPLRLESPEGIQLLDGYSPDLQRVIELAFRKLESHNNREGTSSSGAKPRKRQRQGPAVEVASSLNPSDGAESTVHKRRKKTPYRPRYRSGAYAILVTLRLGERRQRPFMSKSEICEEGQPLSDAPLLSTAENNYYCGWSSMGKQLIHGGFVTKCGNPCKYSLTEEGRNLADELISSHGNIQQSVEVEFEAPISPRNADALSTGIVSMHETAHSQLNQTRRIGGSREVRLCVDVAEQYGRGHHDSTRISMRLVELTKNSVERRKMEIGDYCWLVYDGEDEVVLDVIIERKSIDDLFGSIRDGRYHRQKAIIQRLGLQRKYYLLEGSIPLGDNSNDQSVRTAITKTMTTDGFSIIKTMNTDDTAVAVAALHAEIDRTIRSMSEEKWRTYRQGLLTFAEFTAKVRDLREQTVGDAFALSLTSVRGVGWKAAVRLQEMYKTPATLFGEIERSAQTTRDCSMLEKLKTDDGRLVLSKRAAETLTRYLLEEDYLCDHNPEEDLL